MSSSGKTPSLCQQHSEELKKNEELKNSQVELLRGNNALKQSIDLFQTIYDHMKHCKLCLDETCNHIVNQDDFTCDPSPKLLPDTEIANAISHSPPINDSIEDSTDRDSPETNNYSSDSEPPCHITSPGLHQDRESGYGSEEYNSDDSENSRLSEQKLVLTQNLGESYHAQESQNQADLSVSTTAEQLRQDLPCSNIEIWMIRQWLEDKISVCPLFYPSSIEETLCVLEREVSQIPNRCPLQQRKRQFSEVETRPAATFSPNAGKSCYLTFHTAHGHKRIILGEVCHKIHNMMLETNKVCQQLHSLTLETNIVCQQRHNLTLQTNLLKPKEGSPTTDKRTGEERSTAYAWKEECLVAVYKIIKECLMTFDTLPKKHLTTVNTVINRDLPTSDTTFVEGVTPMENTKKADVNESNESCEKSETTLMSLVKTVKEMSIEDGNAAEGATK